MIIEDCYTNQSKPTKIPDIKRTQPKENGKKTFQPRRINWSYLYRGNAARTQTKTNQITPGIQFNGAISINGNQPPKKKIFTILHIKIILAYSPKKNNAKPIAAYSVL